MARGEIKNPDPPTSKGASVGNEKKLITIGTLFWDAYPESEEEPELESVLRNRIPVTDGADKRPVLIYINNLGFRFEKGDKVQFDVIEVDQSPQGLMAINVQCLNA